VAQQENWILAGSAAYKDGYVSLSSGQQAGAITSKHMLTVPTFVANINLKLTGTSANGENPGTSVVLSPVQKTETGDFYGITQSFNGLAIIVDVKHSLIVGLQNNGLNKLESDAVPGELFCNINVGDSEFAIQIRSSGRDV
jgi:hypothetical protein